MRSVRHWTPHYLACRTGTLLYRATHRGYPWLTPAANRLLARELNKSDIGLEFGCGHSTSWIARRVTHLTSIEHDSLWAEKVGKSLAEEKIQNVDLYFQESLSNYVDGARHLPDGSVDFCLIDGVARARCVLASLPKLRPGGLLIIDNANKYLPCVSRSPGSRTTAAGPVSEDWARLAEAFADWRQLWTSSGVTDTAFFYKPE